MAEQRPPVPAVPSVVLALGQSLQARLQWLERRFRVEIGSQYPGNLLRFRLLVREEQVSPEALHALCDPLLLHPLWLRLQEQGLAPSGDRGPRLRAYLILNQADEEGRRLLAPLYRNLANLYAEHLIPEVCVFFVGADPQVLPRLDEAGRPIPCFVLGPVKQFGYRPAGQGEPFETIRLALNALLAANALAELEELMPADAGAGLCGFALGASAIAVARPQMEARIRNSLLQRLAQACLAPAPDVGEARSLVVDALGLDWAEDRHDEPDELWQRRLGRRVAGLFPRWANDTLRPWGVTVRLSRRGYWRVAADVQGDLYHRLQQMLSARGEAQESAQAALAQDVVHLMSALRRLFAQQEAAILANWARLPERVVGEGAGCLMRLRAVVRTAQAGLERAAESVQAQRVQPLWLRSDQDVNKLAQIVSAQMRPVQSAAERARLAFVPPGGVALRLAPFTLLLAAAGADLVPGGLGLVAGLGVGLAFTALAALQQYRELSYGERAGRRELARLYENAIGGLLVSESLRIIRRLQEAVAVGAAQIEAMAVELESLAGEAGRALDDLEGRTAEGTYLERELADLARCAVAGGEIPLEELLAPAAGPAEEALAPAEMLAATVRGELPVAALSAGLTEALGALVARHPCGAIETRVEELLVAQPGRSFSPAATMEALRQRALPLWPAPGSGKPEVALAVMSREAAVAFQGWLAERGGALRLLPTLQRDRITYLRLRPVEV